MCSVWIENLAADMKSRRRNQTFLGKLVRFHSFSVLESMKEILSAYSSYTQNALGVLSKYA
jgi:hypothetical protein